MAISGAAGVVQALEQTAVGRVAQRAAQVVVEHGGTVLQPLLRYSTGHNAPELETARTSRYSVRVRCNVTPNAAVDTPTLVRLVMTASEDKCRSVQAAGSAAEGQFTFLFDMDATSPEDAHAAVAAILNDAGERVDDSSVAHPKVPRRPQRATPNTVAQL